MSKALKPPTDLITDTAGLNGPLGLMQRALKQIDWLYYPLGRVLPQWVDNRLEPWIDAGNGESYPAYPNDTLESMSCLFAHEDEQGDEAGILFTRTVSVIVWVNLKALHWERPRLETAKLEVRSALAELSSVHRVGRCFDQTVTGTAAVFPGFDLSGLETRYLSYPFAGFRLETVVGFANLSVC